MLAESLFHHDIITRSAHQASRVVRGDVVGIVAPASVIKAADLDRGCEALRRAGYQPFYFDSILDQDLYFAGSLERRVRELEEMFVRDEVRAIVCARGGYGANYLLPALDIEKIKPHAKIFIGYSDISCLLTRFLDAAGLVTFHGPMAAKDWAHEDGVDALSWQAALSGEAAWDVPMAGDVSGLVEGEAEGILYGGCLSILVSSLDTPYEIKTKGSILFLEDLAAKPYQIDRMLMQLKLAGHFEGVRGIVFSVKRRIACRLPARATLSRRWSHALWAISASRSRTACARATSRVGTSLCHSGCGRN